MAAKVNMLKKYEKADASKRTDIICNSYPVFIGIINSYTEGAALYSLGLHTFQEVAKEANAVYRVKRCALVNTKKVDEYLENFCDAEM